MKLFLDSSAIIEFMKNDGKAVEAVNAADELYTSTVCAYEVLVGERYQYLKGKNTSYQKVFDFFKNIASLPPTLDDAKIASDIMASLMLEGKMVDPLDTIIAAQAITVDAILLTKNQKHFRSIQKENNMLKASYLKEE